ncbi:right-handed parallel beta-helix repeat-containing protein [Myxococcus llanfairpwllgwyngyllgogerychwyrndrobwllllantysiliogogogochensis]|uniref:right-handed parallel beta-helix repeat-containing protein n=1 Tax=Myxococcus llanfairpwllgwyngyllgogerychwyrndrobwllllantysiliogogogochensis TaxID=2590453 RepID=UPI0015F06330|nr:right-handed parallel beta-helix repeat-containing protein [Myxococcus llanfairpwllgwyngyllgogerychwyrndrobwllllantysiliogogogochensis]
MALTAGLCGYGAFAQEQQPQAEAPPPVEQAAPVPEAPVASEPPVAEGGGAETVPAAPPEAESLPSPIDSGQEAVGGSGMDAQAVPQETQPAIPDDPGAVMGGQTAPVVPQEAQPTIPNDSGPVMGEQTAPVVPQEAQPAIPDDSGEAMGGSGSEPVAPAAGEVVGEMDAPAIPPEAAPNQAVQVPPEPVAPEATMPVESPQTFVKEGPPTQVPQSPTTTSSQAPRPATPIPAPAQPTVAASAPTAMASTSSAMTAAGGPRKEWHVSKAGNDKQAGSKQAPFRTIRRALTAVGPGDVIRVQAGEYPGNIVIDGPVRGGQPGAPIRLVGEGRVRIVPGGERGTLVQVRRPYWRVEGFDVDVRKQKRFAVAFERDTQGSALLRSTLHGGALGAAVSTALGARGVLIEGNHIHDFRKAGGGDSHGVVVQATSRNITIRGNDIHDTSADGVQCLKPDNRNQAPADGVRIENNHLHHTRENAVDIKTCRNVTVVGNRMHGFRKSRSSAGEAVVVHYSASNVRVEKNGISDAGRGISVGGVKEGPDPKNIVVRGNRINGISKAGGSDGTGIRVENAQGVQIEGNTVEGTAGYGMMLGLGSNNGAPSKDVLVQGNTVRTANLVRLGNKRPGLRMDNNRYATNGNFKSEGKETKSINDWKSLSGVDKASSQQ